MDDVHRECARGIGRETAQAGPGDHCTKKCKEVGEITVSMKTRATIEVASSSTGSFKRPKLDSSVRDQFVSYREDLNSPENHSVSLGNSENLDRRPVSRCSSNDSSEFVMKRQLRSVDLKVESHTEGYETDNSDLIKYSFSRGTTTATEIFTDMDALESSTVTNTSAASVRRRHTETKMPPAAEIDEFLAAAEKHEQKRFADKYNYDVTKDVPLVGRYQWVLLKP